MTSSGAYFEPGTRLQSITSNFGYQLHLQYARDDAFTPPDLLDWKRIIKVTGINNAVDFCDPLAPICTGLTQTWPTATYNRTGSFEYVTDALGRQTRFTYGGGGLTAIRRPSSTSADHITIAYTTGRVSSVSNGTASWTYAYSDSAGVRTTTITDPLGHAQVVTSRISTGIVLTYRDGESRTTSYQYDSNNRLTRVTRPEGNYIQFTLDGRGNVTQATEVAKFGSGLSSLTATASYPGTCANPLTCNQPDSTTDIRGFRTNYSYDPSHGGVLTVTSPAPTGSAPIGSGIRPQTRYAYEQRSARYYVAAGTPTNGAPIYVLVSVSSCATSSSCAGGEDETLSTIAYPDSGTLNNLWPVSSSSGAGNASLTATQAFVYDNVGNMLSVDGPLAGSADTMRYRYDAGRQLIGSIGPDPDGAGGLKHRATRFSYNADGQLTSVERGTVDSQSDADWSAFAPLEAVTTTYDFVGRPSRVSLAAAGATHRVSQFSYDNANRLECSTVRMNPAIFASLPSSACSLGTEGSFGPDRIERLVYNNADQQTRLTTGYGTLVPIDAWTATYTSNALLATIADGAGNLTTYEYDGLDRLSKIRFPNPTGGGSSTTDYELYTYDLANNRAVIQMRGANPPTRTLNQDNLGRLTFSDASTNGPDITYGYDNFGRVTSASIAGHTISFTYDQLSRMLSEQGPLGAGTYTTSYQYDIASRRTRITWPDGVYAQYDWDLANEIAAIRENGASSGAGVLAQYSYDDLGRRSSITRGNGVTTSYTYASSLLLQQLSHDLSGTSQDQSLSFTYNPADQIVSRAGSNALYAWSPLPEGTTVYADNGLNQYTAVAGVSQTYDARSSLTTGGLSYDIDNRLISGPDSASLSYDPAGRLNQTQSASIAATRFLYEGDQIIGEYTNAGVLTRRFVPGLRLDDPVVWYEGAGTSDRRWLLADQLGSVIAITDGSAVATSINSYDEYGSRAVSNVGRFQYTGQPWLPEVSLYHYRYRAYSPVLGRFNQTDPIRYAGGLNLFSYVENDPLNWIDPWGLQVAPDPDQDEIIVTLPRYPTASFPLFFPTISADPVFGDLRLSSSDDEEILVIAYMSLRQKQRWFASLVNGHGGISDQLESQVCGFAGCISTVLGFAVGAPEASAAGDVLGPLLGPRGPIFGRGGAGLLNSNNFVRIGWGWRGSATAGRQVFRIAIGSPKGPIHWHFP